MDTIRVVCGLIFKDGYVLLCKRKPGKKLGGYWEFPGGKLEAGESIQDCLKRELLEELGMQVEVGELFKTIVHHYDSFIVELTALVCQYKEATFVLTDHDEYRWVQKVNINEFNLAPADLSLANELIMRIT